MTKKKLIRLKSLCSNGCLDPYERPELAETASKLVDDYVSLSEEHKTLRENVSAMLRVVEDNGSIPKESGYIQLLNRLLNKKVSAKCS